MTDRLGSETELNKNTLLQSGTTQENPVTQKVTLVIEYENLFPLEASVLNSLNRLLMPSNVELTLVHAELDWLTAESSQKEYPEILGKTLPELESRLKQANQKARQTLLDLGFEIVEEIDCGLRDKSLKRLTETLWETEQDLLVIATVSAHDNQPAQPSHFASRLAAHSPVSVLMLRNPIAALPPQPFKILFGVDGSETSMNAARKLGQILQTRQSELELALVQSPVYQENAVLAPYVNQAVLDEALEVNAKMVFEMIADILEPQGLQVLKQLKLSGSPATELGHLAQIEHPDLLVVGSHNRKGLLAWLMGSVSSQLMQWDRHNLLIVR
ncbi:universal stress protein [Vampirovibrio sp.]|uniref:universal stress protein n=1 Tax=Vampirovibrio sp. TaxID=2717857 RepID=UPI003593B8B0